MKNRIYKKILSLLLSFVIVLSVLPLTPITAYASDIITSGEWTYHVLEDGTAELISAYLGEGGYCYAYSGTETKIEIPSEIDGYTVTSTAIHEHVSFAKNDIVSVKFPNTIKNIGSDTFYYCSSLVNIELSNGITSIGDSAFSGCTSLKSINIPDSVTSIGNSAFSGCTSLTTIKMPTSVKSIGYGAFNYCTALSIILIPESVEEIGNNAIPSNAVVYCYIDSFAETYAKNNNLEYVSISNYINSTIYTPITKNKMELTKYIGEEEEVIVPSTIDEYSVVAIADKSFVDNSYVENITLPETLLMVGTSAFEGCNNLNSVTFADGVKTIGKYAFANCKKLSKVVLPSTITQIEAYTFKNCQSLNSITIPESVTEIDLYAFYNCLNLETIYGITGSYAETFANENGYTFIDVSDMIVDITSLPVTLIENSKGYFYFDYNFYYYDSFLYDMIFNVKYGDGNVATLNYWELESLLGDSIQMINDQYESPFTLGNNKIELQCGDYNFHFYLKIIKNPVISIEIADIDIIEGTNGYFSTYYDDEGNEVEYYSYRLSNIPFTATLNDGTVLKSTDWGNLELYGQEYSLDTVDNQYGNPWQVGEHIVIGDFCGVSDEFTVTITETPIESIVCEDLTVMEYTNGYYTTHYEYDEFGNESQIEYYRYNCTPKYTITLKNGDVITDTSEFFTYNGTDYWLNISDNQSATTQWTKGNTYPVLVRVMGVECTYNVTITETNIKSVSLVPSNPFYQELNEDFGANDYILTIQYKDGTTEISTCNTSELSNYGITIVTVDGDSAWTIGTHIAIARYCGVTFEFEYEVLENPYESIEISNKNGLTIIFKKADGTTVETIPYYFKNTWGDEYYAGGTLFTSIGKFEICFYYDYNLDTYESFEDKNVKLVIGDMESNILPECNWLKAFRRSAALLMDAMCVGNMNNFDGNINASNIDSITQICLLHFQMDYLSADGEYLIIDGQKMRDAICDIFDTKSIDLSISKNYDSINDTIKVFCGGSGGVDLTVHFEYSNNKWIYKESHTTDNGMVVAQIELDDELKVKKIFWTETVVMDVNEDGKVDNGDYDMLVDTSITKTILTDSQTLSGDINGDGAVDAFDAVYLDLYINGYVSA